MPNSVQHSLPISEGLLHQKPRLLECFGFPLGPFPPDHFQILLGLVLQDVVAVQAYEQARVGWSPRIFDPFAHCVTLPAGISTDSVRHIECSVQSAAHQSLQTCTRAAFVAFPTVSNSAYRHIVYIVLVSVKTSE